MTNIHQAKGSIPAGSDANMLYSILTAPPEQDLEIVTLNMRGGDSGESIRFWICPPNTNNGTTPNSGSGMYSIYFGEDVGGEGTQQNPICPNRLPRSSFIGAVIPRGWRLMISSSSAQTLAFYASALCIVRR